MPASWAGIIGGRVGGTGNVSPIAIEWDETNGQMMLMVATQGRALASGQMAGDVSWGTPDGWTFVTATTKIDPYNSGEPSFNGSFISQAVYIRLGTETLNGKTAELTHNGLSGGQARVDIYGIDDAAPYAGVFFDSGYAADPTTAIAAGFRDAVYVALYADSSGATPTWDTLPDGFTEFSRTSTTSIGRARAYLVSAGGWKAFPQINGANIEPLRDEFPWVYHMVIFGTRSGRRGLGMIRG